MVELDHVDEHLAAARRIRQDHEGVRIGDQSDLADRSEQLAALNARWEAEKAGLKEGDKFISLAGVPIVGQQQLIDLIHKRGGVERCG
jgi:C-terminal processing protease CtpA/Prc